MHEALGLNDIIYHTATASETDIRMHLEKCSDSFVPPLHERVKIADYSKKIASHAVTFEAWDGKELTGLIAAYFNPENRLAFITSVSVVKSLMGKGIASILLNNCLAYAAQNNYRELTLEVSKDNVPAIRFYTKFRFTQTGIKGDSIIMGHTLQSPKTTL